MTDQEKLNKMATQIGQIHQAVFGAEGQGGVLRELDDVAKRMSALENFKVKMIGVVIGVSAVMSHIAPKLTEAIVKSIGGTGMK